MFNWSREPGQLAGVFGKYWQQNALLQWMLDSELIKIDELSGAGITVRSWRQR